MGREVLDRAGWGGMKRKATAAADASDGTARDANEPRNDNNAFYVPW